MDQGNASPRYIRMMLERNPCLWWVLWRWVRHAASGVEVMPEYFCNLDANMFRLDYLQRTELNKGLGHRIPLLLSARSITICCPNRPPADKYLAF
ncbi:hypothetical protein GSI_14915 [Ganoderma sinense ZZ0214-1]|uniref:Uncharacterized protein n=1 Tax=Ganoderma sinense ZZ0214-1 TaxID=1077348 RepID=A0A2G8RQ22_9APHY|nr:hypothetical protein GSI_14915 [Ganoderma sinense ZZ0214-1]